MGLVLLDIHRDIIINIDDIISTNLIWPDLAKKKKKEKQRKLIFTI